ncbi:MAG: hypothetical protein BA872_00830 [Desulfobacterales bacterium C00003060]|jgi:hypothetical protein|nr:MAG: hypothetical protein BA861_04445 [Desulfobacterales bacterium S3730MH5]OEU78567.1 MAG: hypothetical protein BA872_00830 [Desulfobacterales bacterium C00003060]
MPLPLGHAALGLATHDVCSKNNTAFSQWKFVVFVIVLANLPDIDVLIGLLFKGNGCVFHRGPTHSLFFALSMGFLASIAWRFWSQIPKISFGMCFLVILSHVLADFLFTSSQVSFFWPFEVNWATGYSGWGDVMNSVFLQAFQDIGIIIGCGLIVILSRLIRGHPRSIRTIANEFRVFLRHACPIVSCEPQRARKPK